MIEKIKHIADTLRAARDKKGLSQRDLSAKVGVPQSHISKIETGSIDLRTTSLIELARSLEMELMLIPTPLVTMVEGIIRSASHAEDEEEDELPAYRLDED